LRIAGVGGVPTGGAAAWPPFAAVARTLEAEQERWFLWLPVMFGGGIALYSWLPAEPWVVAAVLPVVGALALHLTVGRGGMAALMTAALLTVAFGIAAAKLRTEVMRAPVLKRQRLWLRRADRAASYPRPAADHPCDGAGET
jgi:competence protein ComEC